MPAGAQLRNQRYTFIHSPSGHVLRLRLSFGSALILKPFLMLRRFPPWYQASLGKSGFGHAMRKGGRITMVRIDSPELLSATEDRRARRLVAE